MSEKKSGTIKFFNEKKGFGFIKTDAGDIFVHANDCEDKQNLPRENDQVEFVLGESKKGACAKEVEIV